MDGSLGSSGGPASFLMEPPTGVMYVLVWLLFSVCGVASMVCTRLALALLPGFPLCLLCAQSLVPTLVQVVGHVTNVAPVESIAWSQAQAWVDMALAWSLCSALAVLGTASLPVATVVAFAPTAFVARTLFGGQVVAKHTGLLTRVFGVMSVLGLALYVWEDGARDAFGYKCMLLGLLAAAALGHYQRRLALETRASPWSVSYYARVVSLVVFVPLMVVVEDVPVVWDRLVSLPWGYKSLVTLASVLPFAQQGLHSILLSHTDRFTRDPNDMLFCSLLIVPTLWVGSQLFGSAPTSVALMALAFSTVTALAYAFSRKSDVQTTGRKRGSSGAGGGGGGGSGGGGGGGNGGGASRSTKSRGKRKHGKKDR